MKIIISTLILLSLIHITGCKNDSPDPNVENNNPVIQSDTVYFLGSSTIEYFNNQLQLWPQRYHLNAINLGKGGELIDSMCIRIGAIPAHAQFFETEIKSDTKNYFKADWTTDHALKTFDAKIAGVEGKVGIDSNGYYFETNNSVSVNLNEKFKIESLQNFSKNPILVANFGKNNLLNQTHGAESSVYVLEKSKQCIEWIDRNITTRILVIGHFSAVDSNENLQKDVNYLNQELSHYYADKFFDLNGYLSSQNIWQDIQTKPDTNDLNAQQFNMLSSRLASDPIHLNEITNAVVTQKIYEKIKEKKWVK